MTISKNHNASNVLKHERKFQLELGKEFSKAQETGKEKRAKTYHINKDTKLNRGQIKVQNSNQSQKEKVEITKRKFQFQIRMTMV